MYLIVTEECKFYKTDRIYTDELNAWEDGLIDIIDLDKRKVYLGSGNWEELREWGSLANI
jgi:hypothetical protein